MLLSSALRPESIENRNNYVYGHAGAINLAISNPDIASMNADNHEYFAENTPWKP
jgi:peptidyl-Lys metalloendopeptidase